MKSKEYAIYQNMLEAVKTADVNAELTFNCSSPKNEMLMFLARELAKLAIQNPLKPEDPGYNEYEDLIYFCDTWPVGKPECAFKKRFLYAAYKLCQDQPSNIFDDAEVPETVSLEAMQEHEYEVTELEDEGSGTYVAVEEPQHIFGVLPFEDEGDYAISGEEDATDAKPVRSFKRKNGKRRR